MTLSTRRLIQAIVGSMVLALPSGSWGQSIDSFTEPYRDIDVAASEMGLLVSVDVEEGNRVKAGQVLARLDDAVLQAAFDIAKCTMESEGRLESAEAELELQASMVEKLRELAVRGHASEQELERANTQLRIAKARLLTTREEHHVRALECERRRLQVEQRRLVSPIDGIVTRIFKDQGEYVALSDPGVLKVVQLDPLLAVFSVPAKQGRRIVAGDQVRLNVENAPTQGLVEFVSPTADPQSETIRVRVRIPNPEEKLPSGAPCRLTLPGDKPAARPVAP